MPALDKKLDYANGRHSGGMMICLRLGMFRNNLHGVDTWYHFNNSTELQETIRRMHVDFVEQAEPWLARFQSLDDVATEFHRRRILARANIDTLVPDPFASAIYGWLLQEAGRSDESRQWLTRALEEVRRPRYWQGNRVVPEGTKGARIVPLSPEATRLIELLQEDLYEEDKDKGGES